MFSVTLRKKMKKILFILILFTAHIAVLYSTAGVQDDAQKVPMHLKNTLSLGGVGKPKRSPLHIPDVLYANNSLYFDDSQTGCMFEIYDESENVIIKDYVPSNSVYSLPDDINGELTLVLYIGNYAFEGVISK